MELLSSFLFTTGMLATLWILFVLLRTPQKELPQKLLLCVFLFLFFVCFYAYGELHEVLFIKQISFLFADAVGFALGPLLFIYIQSLYRENKDLLKRYAFHFIPLWVYLLFVSLPRLFSFEADSFLYEYKETLDSHEFILQLQGLYLIIYCLISLQTIREYQKLLKQNYANLQEKDLQWVRFLLLGIVLTLLVNICLVLAELYWGEFTWESSNLTTFVMVGMILYLGYHGSSQSRILIPDYLLNHNSFSETEDAPATPSHHLTNASETEIAGLKTRLEKSLQEDHVYLEEDLSLSMLAEILDTTDKKLSALLNHYLDINFYDLINQYRVEAVQAKMLSSAFEHYTLLAIAFESGFKSKTSFNRIFKKSTGFSPSEYRKKKKIENG